MILRALLFESSKWRLPARNKKKKTEMSESTAIVPDERLRFVLPIVILVYLFLVMVLPTIRFKRNNPGVNPFVRVSGDSAFELGQRMMLWPLFLLLLGLLCYSVLPRYYWVLSPITYLHRREHSLLVGAMCISIGIFIVMVGQYQMGASWRFGVDKANSTALVARGLYSYSRNPIYVGAMLTTLGYFIWVPTAVTLASLAISVVAINFQVRLEEEHMRSLHGKQFDNYCREVPRWL
jgi:protein-S-isoprenylcysteine O-methyltransferase Ste14